MHALLKKKPNWEQSPQETRRTLVLVSTDATIAGIKRAAQLFHLLLPLLMSAGRGFGMIGRFLLVPSGLVVRKGPHGEAVELHEEYPQILESQAFTIQRR